MMQLYAPISHLQQLTVRHISDPTASFRRFRRQAVAFVLQEATMRSFASIVLPAIVAASASGLMFTATLL
jgi:hypothetical protein